MLNFSEPEIADIKDILEDISSAFENLAFLFQELSGYIIDTEDEDESDE